MMDKYKDASLPIEERVADLLSRMTLEEKIMQTDQYSIIGDYTKRDAEERVEEFRWEEFEEAIKDRSVGSVQFRSASPQLANQLQRYAVEKTRLGIPFLFSEEALHGLYDGYATCFPQQIGLAGTFEPELGRRMGRAIGAEARASGVHETWNPWYGNGINYFFFGPSR